MGEFFEKEFDIRLTPESEAIHFAHKRSCDKPDNYRLHLNECIEIYFFIEGDADYLVEEQAVSLKRGDVLIISPHAVHVPVLHNACVYERFYMLLPLNVFSSFSFDAIPQFLARPASFSPKLSLTDEEREEVLLLLYRLSTTHKTTVPSDEITRAGLLFLSLGILAKAANTFAPPTPQKGAAIPPLLREILQYISIAPQEITSVRDIAAHFHISPPYLSALFKRYIGVGACGYLHIKKIAMAKKLLEDGSSVADACYTCGFSDSSHFIKIFKQYIGMTPNRYKNYYTKQDKR